MNGGNEAGVSAMQNGQLSDFGSVAGSVTNDSALTGAGPDYWADIDRQHMQPSFFIISDEAVAMSGGADVGALGMAFGYRTLGRASLADAPDRLSHIVDVDMVLLRCTGQEPGLDLLLTRLDSISAMQGAHLVIITSLVGLDMVHALVRSERAMILCDPDPVDLISALAIMSSASAPDQHALHDIGREAGENRLDRLSEELVRLSRTIEALVEGRSPSQSQPARNQALGPDSVSALSWGQNDGVHGKESDGGGFAVHAASRDFAGFPASSPEPANKITAAQVRAVLRMRRLREQIFPTGLFADPAWDILLDLMAARLEKNQVSVSSLCIAAAVPPTTALRWIRHLTDCNLLEREADPDDGRRIFITLSEKGSASVQRWFQESMGHMALVSGGG